MDNRLLLDRLGEAMSRKNIDNDLVPQHFVSYLELQRKKQLIKITRENQRLLHRIQRTIPTYHPEEWEKDAQKHEEYLRNMTEFPELYVAPGERQLVGNLEGIPDRFSDHLGGGITLSDNERHQQLTAHPLYSTRRSGQSTASQSATLRRTLGSNPSRISPTNRQRQLANMSQEEADAALVETEAMFRHAFNLQSNHSPQPPAMPPVLHHTDNYQDHQYGHRPHSSGDDEEEDFSRNQFISRPFLPDIHQSSSNASGQTPPGVVKKR